MSPLTGVITKIRRDVMFILLNSGTIIQAPRQAKFNFGSRVKILYDFTRMKVRDIVLESEVIEGCGLEQPIVEDDEDTEIIDPQFEYYDSLIDKL